jgi:hypothetical protein
MPDFTLKLLARNLFSRMKESCWYINVLKASSNSWKPAGRSMPFAPATQAGSLSGVETMVWFASDKMARTNSATIRSKALFVANCKANQVPSINQLLRKRAAELEWPLYYWLPSFVRPMLAEG